MLWNHIAWQSSIMRWGPGIRLRQVREALDKQLGSCARTARNMMLQQRRAVWGLRVKHTAPSAMSAKLLCRTGGGGSSVMCDSEPLTQTAACLLACWFDSLWGESKHSLLTHTHDTHCCTGPEAAAAIAGGRSKVGTRVPLAWTHLPVPGEPPGLGVAQVGAERTLLHHRRLCATLCTSASCLWAAFLAVLLSPVCPCACVHATLGRVQTWTKTLLVEVQLQQQTLCCLCYAMSL
jgi:hypothetical protein